MSRALPTILGVLTVLAIIFGPIVFAYHQQNQMRNFRIVREGVLYRSGQMSIAGLERVIHDYGIRTVISLRDHADPAKQAADVKEEQFCRKLDLNFVRIPPRSWEAAEGPAPVEPEVRKFCDILRDPRNHPVLVHCFAGIHRTGAYCAVYRMEFEGWSNARAIGEVKACGYTHLDEEWDILGYLEHFRPTGPTTTAQGAE